VQIAQNIVCNNSHSVEQRAARWLLTTRDRVNGDQFPLTQEFLAQMLGVRQPTVSDTAGPGPHPISSRDHHHTRPRGFGGARLPLLPGRPRRVRRPRRIDRNQRVGCLTATPRRSAARPRRAGSRYTLV
jgi:hypothetical protein